MKETKLINTLRTFSKEEMKMFGKFVASPFHNNGIKFTPLFKQLQKCYPDFEPDKLTREILYKKLYPGKKFNKQVMWNLTSAMEKMTKEFLAQVALRKNKFKSMGLMLSEFGSRKLLYNYSRTLADMEKLLDACGIDYEYFDNKGHLENYKQGYYHLIDKVQDMSASKLKASECQVLLFLRMTVGGLSDMKLLRDSYNYRYDVNIPLEFAKRLDLRNIVEYANRNNFEYAYLIEIYYHSLMMLLEPKQTNHLNKTRELYRIHYKKFTMSEKRNIMHWIVNYCLNNIDLHEAKYRRIIFESNKFRLKEGFAYYPENQLPKAIYIQILNSALVLNESKWAVNFIENYTAKLQPDIQESMKCMAYAFLSFHTKEYRKVLKYLNKVEFVDIQEKSFARTLSARSYYELNELETLLNYIESSKRFLVNNPSVSEINRTYTYNFFKYLKKIVFIREKKDRGKIFILRKEIEKNEEISNAKWLLEKLNELEKEK
jgi:hypothetical protein